MNLPPQLQQQVENWASRQGISSEQFILQAVTEKVSTLDRQNTEATVDASSAAHPSHSQQPKVYRKEGILVVEAEPVGDFDINEGIDEMREERIREQMGL